MDVVTNLITNALADKTVTSYWSWFQKFRVFCAAANVPTSLVLPPASAQILAFVSQLYLDGNTAGVAARALTSLRSTCRMLGYSVDGLYSKQLEYFMKSYKRLRPSQLIQKRHPATYPIVIRWCRALVSRRKKVAAALLITMFHGFLRPGEATSTDSSAAPCRADLTFSGEYAMLHLPESKTDVYHLGVDIMFAANDSAWCPVTLLRWVLDNAPDKGMFAPLFQKADGSAYRYSDLQDVIVLACSLTSMSSKFFKPHSLRIGAATTAAVLGFPADVIKHLGRWSSSCYQVYTRMTKARFSNVSKSFASSRAFSLVPSEFGALRSIPVADISFDNVGVIFGNRLR